MIESLLIANRGEIARRIIRTARRLGIRTVATYSDADATMPFVREADDAVRIGPAPARDSYLRQNRILEAARQTGVQAIHPGYGFLSENADFAEAVIRTGLIWVGAPPSAIRAMGLKDAAKQRMIAANVPVTPGYFGEDQDPDRLRREADTIGYPVLIKAVAGGGGKGMRRVDAAADFSTGLESCRREAAASFGDDRVLIEKYILSPRHIEVQVFGDIHGNVVHLFERDCSLQRRHQKVVEEAPAPGMDEATRKAVCTAAVQVARAVDYVGAGTVEFIADVSGGLCADRIWFMEMNTRLQVEHPVTEAITGQDLVEWQIRVASGEPVPRRQEELAIDGWAMEVRLYAENPATGFLPSIGCLEHLRIPEGVRIDSGVEQGDEITSHYDPMIAKLISHAPGRQQAARMLAGVAAGVEVWPVHTNAAFLARTLNHPDFLSGAIDTGFIERHLMDLMPSTEPDERVLQAAASALLGAVAQEPWTTLTGFRMNAEASRQVNIEVAGRPYIVNLDQPARGSGSVIKDIVFIDGEAWPFGSRRADHAGGGQNLTDGSIIAPMPGTVIAVSVRQGDRVLRGQPLVILEAMKMEQALNAPFDGTVAELRASPGAQVTEGVLLARIEGED
ncbi:3-methylcrotonyl-CoA carboxylase alpha subunit [Rhizobium sp. NFR07]|uniref:acetyl/propionyl/methylcrotonyl-CoA carboxylase subunit alpha n=1 Tax=Rhizobium sp. NFR07 TaxID=1566262 RepID=UPI0008EFC3D7|nr:acetyl/propionyl/methylcrotonyl-CoA carboxylase subunit alpha [Rhizobium sp. NFR07]SFA82850.1 3-methylcrotonyl-CoA carboxylase alpha subunit [Rhizobium sp. NFR07]